MISQHARPFWLGLALFALTSLGLGFPAETRTSSAQALLPKAEIGALRLLAKHPEFDGRGAVVAILDTGVDPGAEGLQTTTDGKPKVIDVIDATGSGDVDTSTVRKATDGVLEGLTGRKLKLPENLTARDGEFRVGVKSAWNLFPDELVGRMKRVRREAWTEAHRKAVLKAREDLDGKGDKTELQARLSVLETLEQKYDDPGPVFDCVVFHDGTVWRAIVDTDEDGDLADEKPLTDFDRERQWGTFHAEARLNFGVHIYDEGKTLSIVADSGSHGTHVAGIVAAHYPEQPERNGVAPGAQIVGIKIGDTRLASMETGSALLRAATAIVRHKCDLANLSYGEPTTRPDRGLIVSTLGDLADKHNVLFLSSAMNSGPALSTVGAPGGTTTGIISVGAYLSPEMMAAQYSHREDMPGQAYTFTSRGPTADGDMGVAIFAPGGAVAPVPQWTLNRTLQMNGTSMASPNACGGVALLVSALKANKVPYTAASVRRAIQNTAEFVENVEVFAQGPGLLQVDRAWEHLQKYATATAEQLRLSVRIFDQQHVRGVYLRDPADVDRHHTYQVFIRPEFPKDPTHDKELLFDLGLTLESTEEWVDVGPSIQVPGQGRSFEIHIDPTDLPPGAHFAEVRGLDASQPERGPLFRVPVTVLRPIEPSEETEQEIAGSFELAPGQLERHFVPVPATATSATLELKRTDREARDRDPVRIRVDAAFLPEDKRFEVHSKSEVLGEEHTDTFSVLGGEMLELCFIRDWRSVGGWTEKSREGTPLEYTLSFHSVLPSHSGLALPSEGPAVDVTVTAPLGRETVAPSGSLSTRRQLVRPARSTLKPGTERDDLPDGRRLHVLTLEYDFEQASSGSVTPHFPVLDNLLYDSEYGTLMWTLFDPRKKLVASNDIFPDAVSLPADTYTLKLQMKHPDRSRLESVRDVKLALDRSINVPLTFRRERPSGVSGGSFGETALRPNGSTTVWIDPPASNGGAGPDEILIGSLKWTSDGPEYAVRTVFPRTSAPSASAEKESLPLLALLGSKPGDTAGQLAYDRQEFRLRQLLSLTAEADKAAFEALLAESEMEHPGLLAWPYARLRRADDDADQREHRLPEILAAADAVLAKIDATEIEAHFGKNLLPEDAKEQAERKRFTELRDVLIDTLYRKGRALGYMELPEVVAKTPIADPQAHDKAFEENFNALRRWVDTTGEKYYLLHVRKERRKGRHGVALQLLLKHTADKRPNLEHAEKRRDLVEALGWTHQLDYERRRMLVDFPKNAEPF